MKKSELRTRLEKGEKLYDVLPLVSGQECEIFKASEFTSGDDIIYIPDLWLNELVRFNNDTRTSIEYADDVVEHAYTGQDFIDECSGDVEKARLLFSYCNWQNPGSALPEVYDEEEDN